MKKFLVVVSLSLVLAMVAAAQNGPQRGGFGRGGNAAGTPPDPQQMVQMRVDRLSNALSLTDGQKTQATSIFTAAEQAVQPLQKQIAETRKALNAAIKTNNVPQIDQLSATLGTLMGQTTAVQSKAEAQFIAILTPDQQAKLPPGGLPGMGGPGMGGGMGGPGGGGRMGGGRRGGPGGE